MEKIDLKYVLSNTKLFWEENGDEVFPKGVVIFEEDTGGTKISDGETKVSDLIYISDDGQVTSSYSKSEIDDKVDTINDAIDTKANSADVYTKDEINGKIASAFHYKGSVENEDALPTENNEIGDVYNVNDTGSNYAWNGKVWDKLSETIDLSVYYTKTEVDSALDTKADAQATTDALELKADQTVLDSVVTTINKSIDTKADAQATTDALELKADKSELENVVKYTQYGSETRKSINLPLYDAISSDGKVIAFINDWNVGGETKTVLQIGGTQAHTNIESMTTLVEGEKQYGVATINDDAAVLTDKILNNVLVSSGNVKVSEPIKVTVLGKDVYTYEMNVDISQDSSIESLKSQLNSIEARLRDSSKTNVYQTVITEGKPISENDTTKDVVVNGGSATANIGISAASVELSSVSVSNNARTSLSATSDVSLNNVTYSGEFPKADGNAITNIQSAKYVSIKDNTYDLENDTSYNAIEIGSYNETLTAPKTITIDGLNMKGVLSNNAISIHKLADNSIVNINNCHFDKVSNMLRLSNASNAKNITINITNCSCNEWAEDACGGMILCEDTTTKTDSSTQDFSTFTINISNFEYKGEKLVAPKNIADVCGTNDVNQILYVFRDKNYENGDLSTGVESYDSSTYPTLVIK